MLLNYLEPAEAFALRTVSWEIAELQAIAVFWLVASVFHYFFQFLQRPF